MSEVIALIPAREGSRGIPGKNFRRLAGLSPLQRTLLRIQEAGITTAWVTTDSDIASGQVSDMCFAGLICTQPPIHSDTGSMIDVVNNALESITGDPDQIVLLVQTTSVLRTAQHLLAAVKLIEEGAPSIATAVEVEPAAKLYYAGWESVTGQAVERRQDAQVTYKADGLYGFRREWWIRNQAFRTRETSMLVIPSHESWTIDTHMDWKIASFLLA